MFKTKLDRFKTIGLLEGTSFIILLFIAMPLKYIWDMPEFVKVVGMTHGCLFLLYLFTQFEASKKYNWNLKDNILYLVASLVPFGTFISDRKLTRIKAELE
jgi:integral membrane protein